MTHPIVKLNVSFLSDPLVASSSEFSLLICIAFAQSTLMKTIIFGVGHI